MLSDVTFVGDSQEPSVETTWTVGFTVEAPLLSLDSIIITFPDDFDLSGVTTGQTFSPPPLAGTTFGGDFDDGTGAYQVEVSGQVITLYLYDFDSPGDTLLAAGAAGTVAIDGIVNPGAGTYSGASVATNKEPTPVSAADISITVVLTHRRTIEDAFGMSDEADQAMAMAFARTIADSFGLADDMDEQHTVRGGGRPAPSGSGRFQRPSSGGAIR